MCYGLPEADFKALSKMVDKREETIFLKLMRDFAAQKYGGEKDFKKVTRLAQQIAPEDFKAYTNKYREINEMYDILRCVPEIERVAKDALEGTLDAKVYPYLEEKPDAAENGVAKWH